jgi:hypothetical protein
MFDDNPAAVADAASILKSGSGKYFAATSAVPSWMSTLTTASVETDMTAADVDGTVTYSGLKTPFAGVAPSLGAAKLNAAQFADLKTIAANLNVGATASGYLTSMTTALVNGSEANATWTGGSSTHVALGNLAAGSTIIRLNELVGKWFLGADLPTANAS